MTIKPSFMKQLTLKQCVLLLRTCIVLLLLCVVSVFLFSVISNNKPVEDSNKQEDTALQNGNISYAETKQQTVVLKRIATNSDKMVSLLPSALSEQFMQ